MKFLRLNEPLLKVLFEDDDIIAFDKPYGFNTHTNDSKVGQSDFIEDGLIEILEKQRGQRLHIIHRLDQTTTGVIIFGKSQESAKKYAGYFFDRKVRKTYWFITAKKTAVSEHVIDRPIIHKGKELEAKTELRFQKRSQSYELWEAKPFTGRNHQIRIHAQAAGISILGDPKYDGKEFVFLCLHNHRIEFPNDLVITSKPPVYFEDLSILDDHVLAKSYFEIDRRQRLFQLSLRDYLSGTQVDSPVSGCSLKKAQETSHCLRWVHPYGSATQNDFALDQYGEVLFCHWGKETFNDKDHNRLAAIAQSFGKRMFVRHGKEVHEIEDSFASNFAAGNSHQTESIGEKSKRFEENPQSPKTWKAQENGISYELRVEGGAGIGLLLNQRLLRNWVLHNSEGRTVLNLFAQQGAYGLCAAAGKASEVTTVEANKGLLNWGKRNLELNPQAAGVIKSFCRDSFPFIKQAQAKGQKFDVITCEVPSFQRGEKGVFKIETDLPAFVKSCIQCLSEKGTLLLTTTAESLLAGDFRNLFLSLQRELKISIEVESVQASFDFELPYEKAPLKAFLVKRN